MRILTAPATLVAAAALLVAGCDTSSSTTDLRDSDPLIRLRAGDGSSSASLSETGPTTLDVAFEFSEDLTDELTIALGATGTAVEGSDYVLQSESLVVRPSDVPTGVGTFTLQDVLVVIDDEEVEETETVTLSITGVSYGRIAIPSSVVVAIASEDVDDVDDADAQKISLSN